MLQRSFGKAFLLKKRFVVDDGSLDGTAEIAQTAGHRTFHTKNKCKGAAD